MTTFKQRVVAAANEDNTIIVTRSESMTHQGFTTEYLQYLGLRKSDLKKLCRAGLALRGYTKNVWLPGETLPNGKVVENKPGISYRGKGSRVRWVLIKED